MDLFHMQEEAPGMVFWHPNGWTIYRTIEEYIREVQKTQGYQEVRTPQVLSRRFMGTFGALGNIWRGNVYDAL